MELHKIYEGVLSEDIVIEYMEPGPSIFCNKARLLVVHVGHQPIHKNLDPKSVLTAKWAREMVVQNLWE